MPTGSAVRRRINRYAPADCARSSSAARRSFCAPMQKSGQRPCPSLGLSAASRRAHEPCPAQMLWAPLPFPAVAPSDVLRLASASTAPIARPVRPQQRPQARRRTRLSTIAAIRVAVRGSPNRLRMSTAPSAPAAATRVSIGTAVASANATSARQASSAPLSGSIVGPPHRCAAEAQKWPEKYGFEARPVPYPLFPTNRLRSAHSTGLKSDVRGERPTAHCLRGWWWGGDGDRDHSLYDRDGLTVARVVLEGDGRYHLRKPIAIPRQAWAHLEEAKRGAESLAIIRLALPAGFLRRRLAP